MSIISKAEYAELPKDLKPMAYDPWDEFYDNLISKLIYEAEIQETFASGQCIC